MRSTSAAAATHPAPVVRALLAGIVDYAGLFPPSGLTMRDAVHNFAAYRAGEDAWALGRFILPAARLAEFEQEAAALLPRESDATPWRLSALVGDAMERDMAEIRAFNARHSSAAAGAAITDAIEAKAGTVEQIERVLSSATGTLETFIEIPLVSDVRTLLAAVRRGGGRAKVRTGGVTPEAFPSAEQLARFIEACVAEDVPFKATAGLHHPLRAEYRLTYEPGAARARMYGFLNVFLAAALLGAGMPASEVPALLEEESAEALRITDDALEWRGHRLTTQQAAVARARVALSFGSCSFSEPVDDLKELRLL